MLIFRLVFSGELYSWVPENADQLSPLEYQEAFNEARYLVSASLVEQFGEKAIVEAKRLPLKDSYPNLLDIIVIDSSHMENVA